MKNLPTYLKDYESLWTTNPHQANLKWFEQARFGLFIHYGLYFALGEGEWVQSNKRIPVAEYEKLKDDFRADKFDAERYQDVAGDRQTHQERRMAGAKRDAGQIE